MAGNAELVTDAAIAAALLRPLTSLEAQYLPDLIVQVEEKLRTTMPAIDDRIAVFVADPSDCTGIRPGAVSAMLAGVIKRYLTNPKGLWSESGGDGPFTWSETYPGARGGDAAATSSGLEVTPADLASLLRTSGPRIGTIRLRPGMCW